ncbi:MAG: hypothetical protein EA393_06270 [Bacteroidetes bacterium]|nr:MAG: hypothetical protein EA393_06270 [Bacteroidota bacterium]
MVTFVKRMYVKCIIIVFPLFPGLFACSQPDSHADIKKKLAEDVINETLRTWEAYVTYAWGADELLPLSRQYRNWYDEPMYISLIDAYSTLKIMGLEDESTRIEQFVADTISFDKDIYVKAVETDSTLWYGAANKYTGEIIKEHDVTLWDAFLPLVLISSGDSDRAAKIVYTWDKLWNKHSLLPMGYNFHRDEITNPPYYLNPELIESAYYMYHYTNDTLYLNMLKQYWADIKEYCRADIAYTHIEKINIITKEQADQMSTFFFAETLKYFYLAFPGSEVHPENFVFNTEAHPYRKEHFDSKELVKMLGL